MADDLPIGMTRALLNRLMRMLRAFESGQLSPQSRQGAKAAQPDETLVIKITGNATGGGKYLAKLVQPATADVPQTGNLSLAELGTEYTPTISGATILALNTPEVGKSTHALDSGTICLAIVRRIQDSGTLVVVIRDDGYFDCI